MKTIKNIWNKFFGKKIVIINQPTHIHEIGMATNDERVLEKWDSLGFLGAIEEKQELALLLEELGSNLHPYRFTPPTHHWRRRLTQLEWDKACNLIFPCIIRIFRGSQLRPEDMVTRETNIDVPHFISYFFDFYWRHGVVGRNNIFGEYERVDIEAEFCSYLVDCYLGLSEETKGWGDTLYLYRKPTSISSRYFIKKHKFIK